MGLRRTGVISLAILFITASSLFANPIPYGWTPPKQEIAVPSVSDIGSALPLIIVALALELAVCAIFLKYNKLDFGILKYVLIANLISIPIVWAYVFATSPFLTVWHGAVETFGLDAFLFVVITAELFAVVFESHFIHHFNSKKISLKQAFWMAIAANSLSFLLSLPALFHSYF